MPAQPGDQHLKGLAARRLGINAGHAWYFDDALLMEDVFHTISGQLDRREFPTRLEQLSDKGNLVLGCRA